MGRTIQANEALRRQLKEAKIRRQLEATRDVSETARRRPAAEDDNYGIPGRKQFAQQRLAVKLGLGGNPSAMTATVEAPEGAGSHTTKRVRARGPGRTKRAATAGKSATALVSVRVLTRQHRVGWRLGGSGETHFAEQVSRLACAQEWSIRANAVVAPIVAKRAGPQLLV